MTLSMFFSKPDDVRKPDKINREERKEREAENVFLCVLRGLGGSKIFSSINLRKP